MTLQGRLAASFHAARSPALSGILERTTVEQRHARKIQAAAEGSRRSARSQARRDPKARLRGASRQMVESMTERELERMASVPRKSLPQRASSQSKSKSHNASKKKRAH